MRRGIGAALAGAGLAVMVGGACFAQTISPQPGCVAGMACQAGSLAVGGAAIGGNGLAVTGAASVSGTITGQNGVSTSYVQMSSGASALWTNRSQLLSNADGNVTLENNAGTSFGLLQFGGATSGFPALKRNGSELDIRLADDSGPGLLGVGSLSIANGLYVRVRTVTAAGAITVSSADFEVAINKTVGAASAVSIPTGSSSGEVFIVKDAKGDAATNNITITPISGLIDGATSKILNANYQSVTLVADGINWGVN